MKMLKFAAPALLAASLAMGSMSVSASAGEGSPYGTWTMTNGKVTVRVKDCGGKLCGSIVALKEPISKIDGKPKVDRENPDPAKRKRPIIGLSVLIGMKPTGDGKWTGSIYNPDDGNTYSASLEMASPTRMNVKGCVAGILCKTNKFVRVN
jgi:uncharacterized protein (DUF2147 family)